MPEEPLVPEEPFVPAEPLVPELPLVPDEPRPIEPFEDPLDVPGGVTIVVLCWPEFHGCQTKSATIAATTMMPIIATDAALVPLPVSFT